MRFRKLLTAVYFAVLGLTSIISQSAVAADEPAPSIPFKHENVSAGADLPRVAFGLTACLLLLAGAVYLIRRRLGLTLEAGRTKQLRILESHRLNPRSSLYVIEFAGKVHLLAQSEQGINCLVSTPAASPQSAEQQS